MTTRTERRGTLAWFVEPALLRPALVDSVRRLTPRYQWRNPVMFVVYIGSMLTTLLWFQALLGEGEAPAGFILAVTLWLWATLVFANFAEAIAEGRSRAQAATLKSARRDTMARKLSRADKDAAQTQVPFGAIAQGRRRARAAGRHRPRRRRGDRRRGVDQRKRDHRRERPRHPRRGQRLQYGDGRNARCCPTGSSFGSRSIRARRSSTG